MKVYETLSATWNDLIRRGYVFNFNIKSNGIVCVENSINIEPEHFRETRHFTINIKVNKTAPKLLYLNVTPQTVHESPSKKLLIPFRAIKSL